MAFFSKLLTPARVARKRFERARVAETAGQFDTAKMLFEESVSAYDDHFAELARKREDARPSDLVKAGMGYTRVGRNEDALTMLDECIRQKDDIPDAYLHAGFAAAQLGNVERAMAYWSAYPDWIKQPIIHAALKEQLRQLRGASPDPEAACNAVIRAAHRQDRENRAMAKRQRNKKIIPRNRGY